MNNKRTQRSIIGKVFLWCVGFMLLGQAVNAQIAMREPLQIQPKQPLISVNFQQTPLPKALQAITQKVDVGLSYKTAVVPSNLITYRAQSEPVYSVLDRVLRGTDLYYELSENQKVILIKQRHLKVIPPVQEMVSGNVTNAETGEPISNVNIVVRGTNIGTTTNVDGYYSLQVPSLQDTLVFSFVGYESKVVAIEGRTEIDITLKPQTVMAEELVVVGYGTKSKENIIGAVASVDVENVQAQSATNPLGALVGQASGLTIIASGQPGTVPNIHIRGMNTFGNNKPLYVVDGIPTENIQYLNTNDIESIQILKDAASASIYGSRASNGVIVITTKEGKGGLQINYNVTGGIGVPPHGDVWNLANTMEQAKIRFLANKNSGNCNSRQNCLNVNALALYHNPSNPGIPMLHDYIEPLGAMEGDPSVDPSKYYVVPLYGMDVNPSNFYRITPANKKGTDWYHEVLSPSYFISHNIQISGSNDRANYLFSIDYVNNRGSLINQYLKRYSLRSNTSFDISDDIHIGENISYVISHNPTYLFSGANDIIGSASRYPKIIPVYDIMGNFAGAHVGVLGNAENPVATAVRNKRDINDTNRLFGNVFAKIDLLDDHLFLKTVFGGERIHTLSSSFQFPSYEDVELQTRNAYSKTMSEATSYTWTTTARYKQNFNSHSIELLAGVELIKEEGSIMGGRTLDYFTFDKSYVNLTTGSGTMTNSSSRYKRSLFSIFGRLNYNYKHKYLVNFTVRRDGSSKFLNNKFGIFPAAGIGWIISNEQFFNFSWISNLKIHASYGVMGNQLNVSPYNPYTLFGNNIASSYYPTNNNNLALGFGVAHIGNPDATWEKDYIFDVGLDVGLFAGRLNISVSYYHKRIEGLLYRPPLPGTAGTADVPAVNIGNIRNRGFDISLNAVNHFSEDLQMSASATITTYDNMIKEIAPGIGHFDQARRRYNLKIVRNAVGHPISSFYGYKIVGFWDSQTEIDKANKRAQKKTDDPDAVYQQGIGLGFFRYKDVNGDGIITTEDRSFLGNPQSDFTYGINFSLKYKNIDFSMFWYGAAGRQIYNNVKWWDDFTGNYINSFSEVALYDSWRPDNKNATVPRLVTNATASTNKVPNSYFVENGSYLRLKNIVIGYTLPERIITRFGINKLRVYLQTSNLLTITPYSGVDPVFTHSVARTKTSGRGQSSTTAFGIDSTNYPTLRKFIFGINLSF